MRRRVASLSPLGRRRRHFRIVSTRTPASWAVASQESPSVARRKSATSRPAGAASAQRGGSGTPTVLPEVPIPHLPSVVGNSAADAAGVRARNIHRPASPRCGKRHTQTVAKCATDFADPRATVALPPNGEAGTCIHAGSPQRSAARAPTCGRRSAPPVRPAGSVSAPMDHAYTAGCESCFHPDGEPS